MSVNTYKREVIRDATITAILLLANIRYFCIGQVMSEIPVFINLLFIIPVFFLSLVSVVLIKLSRKEILRIILLLGVSLLVVVYSRQTAILVSVVVLISLKNIPIEKVIFKDMIAKLIVVFSVAFSCLIGLAADVQREQSIFGISINAHSFGFSSVNTLGLLILLIIIEYAYYKKEKISILEMLNLLIIGVAFSFLSSSRTLMVGILILFGLYVVYFRVKKFTLPFWLLFVFSIPFVLLSYFYQELPFSSVLNSFMTGRLWLGYAYFQLYPIRWFGNYILYNGEQYQSIRIILDNYFIRSILNFGIVYTFIYFYAFLKKMINNKRIRCIDGDIQNIIIVLVFICSIVESNFYNAFFNPAMFFLVSLIYGDSLNDDHQARKISY